MAVYTNEDGTVTYIPTHNISIVSTVSLIKLQVIDDDDNGTPEDIFISVPIEDECQQGMKVHMKIDTGACRNIVNIKTLKELLRKNVKMGPPRIAVRAYGNFNFKVLGCYQTCCR